MDPICLLKWTNFESVWIVTHLSLFCEGIYIRKGFPIVNLDFTLRKWWFVLKHCMISHNYPLDIQIPRTEKTFQSKHVTSKCKILSVPRRKLTANISHLYPTWTPKHHRLKSVFKKGDMNMLDSQEGYPNILICITVVEFYGLVRSLRVWRMEGTCLPLQGSFQSGQIIATSNDLTQNGVLVWEIPLFQGNLGWWNYCNLTRFQWNSYSKMWVQ